jgi:hypothetical protein
MSSEKIKQVPVVDLSNRAAVKRLIVRTTVKRPLKLSVKPQG